MTAPRPVHAAVELHGPFELARAALGDAAPCVTGMDAPGPSGWHTRIALNVQGGSRLQQDVVVTVGEAVQRADGVAWPISWEPAGHRRVLPAFDGTMMLRRGGNGTELALSGTYGAPFGVVGVIVDKAIGHRVAAISVEAFLRSAARRVEAVVEQERDAAQPRPATPENDAASGEYWLG